MCRLFSFVANEPKECIELLEKFKDEFSEKNPHGWGIGWYTNKQVYYFKEGVPANAPDSKFSQTAKETKSEIIIAHVRELSNAPPATENSHPFQHENWLFIHNGSVDREHLYSLLEPKFIQKITGETDTEVYFYWVIQNIEKYNNNVIEGVITAVREVIGKYYTGINFILSDGTTLYAFRYSQNPSDHYTLFKLERNHSDASKKDIIICSETITDEPWEPIGFGHMFIVSNSLGINEVKIV